MVIDAQTKLKNVRYSQTVNEERRSLHEWLEVEEELPVWYFCELSVCKKEDSVDNMQAGEDKTDKFQNISHLLYGQHIFFVFSFLFTHPDSMKILPYCK